MDIPKIVSEPSALEDLDLEIPDIEAAIEELSKLADSSKIGERSYKTGDRLWVLDQDFPMPLLATVTEIYPDNDEVYFKYDGRSSETYSSRDHGVQLLVPSDARNFPANFKNALKTLWQHLVIRKVKFVKKDNRGYIKYYDGRERDTVEYSSRDEVHRLLSTADRSKIVRHEHHYYGFTTSEKLYPNDIYEGTEFFFGSDNTGQITHNVDWSLFNIPMGLSVLNGDKPPPLNDKLICGIPEKTKAGNQLSRWISCSRQFVNLWEFVMDFSDKSPESMVTAATKFGHHHPKYNMLKDIFEHLDTKTVAMLCVDNNLINQISKELRDSKRKLDDAGIVQWVTTDSDSLGIHLTDAAKIYMKTMVTVYGIPKSYKLFLDQPTD